MKSAPMIKRMHKLNRRRPEGKKDARPFTLYPPADLDLWIRARAAANFRTLTAETILLLQAGRRAVEAQAAASDTDTVCAPGDGRD